MQRPNVDHIIDSFTTSVTLAVPVVLERITGYYLQSDITVTSAVSGASVKIQTSATGVAGTFVDLADSSQSFTATGTLSWSVSRVKYAYIQVVYTLSSGTIDVVQTVDRRDD